MGVSHFKDLECWQLSGELKTAVYEITGKPPVNQDRDFCNDIKRSARSAPANIAEGFGRYTHREFAHFLSIARASLTETENHLQHLKSIGDLSDHEWRRLVDVAQRAQKATSRLRTYLSQTSGPPKRHDTDDRSAS